MHIRVVAGADRVEAVLRVLRDEPFVTGMTVVRGAAERPPGDLIEADVPREIAARVVADLHATEVTETGSIHMTPVPSWLSRPAFVAEREAPGHEADSVVWSSAVQQAYTDSELNGVYLAFMTMATLLAGIAIILDSPILVIGAMVIGPEFGPIAALGVGLVRRRPALLRRAGTTLVTGFVVAITLTLTVSAAGRALGWVSPEEITDARSGTSFIYSPDRWSLVVAVIAAAAGVLSLTSSRTAGIAGVFMSVTTVPAAANIAVGSALGLWDQVRGSALQLLVNLVAMAVSGWLTLVVQEVVTRRTSARRRARRASSAVALPASVHDTWLHRPGRDRRSR